MYTRCITKFELRLMFASTTFDCPISDPPEPPDEQHKRRTRARRSHTPLARQKRQGNAEGCPPTRKPRMIDGVTWTPTDRPLFRLRDKWWLATDDQLQWVLYRLRGQQWQAVLITLRERVAARYGTLDGLDALAIQAVNDLPDHFRDWLRLGNSGDHQQSVSTQRANDPPRTVRKEAETAWCRAQPQTSRVMSK
jgi:hypothetical protein